MVQEVLTALDPSGKPVKAQKGSAAYKEQKADKKVKADEKKAKKNNTYTDDKTQAAVDGMPGVASKAKSLSGLPIGTSVNTNGAFTKIQYSTVASRERFATMGPDQRRDLLLQMSKIPGLYAEGQAPTESYIAEIGAEFYSDKDFAALDKLMAHADLSGQRYQDSLVQFYNNPDLAFQTFGPAPKKPKAIRLSSPDELQADFNSKFMDLFDSPADKRAAKAYSNEIIKAQTAAGGASNFGPQMAENIFQKYVRKQANSLIDNALDPDAKPITDGAFGMTVTQLKNAYAENYLSPTDKRVYKDAIAAARSPQAMQNILQKINIKATQYYPAVAEALKNGMTVSDALDAPISAYARIFGVPANKVPQEFLSKVAGGTTILPQEEVERIIYNTEGIEKTQTYKNQQLNDFSTMMNTFGIGPT